MMALRTYEGGGLKRPTFRIKEWGLKRGPVHHRRMVCIPVFLFAIVFFCAGVSTAAVYEHIGSGLAWPSDSQWVSIPSLNDPNDGVTPNLDFVGDANNPGFYVYNDGTYLYFRMRVNFAGTVNANTFSDTVWLMVDAGPTPDGIADYAFAWDSKSSDVSSHGLEMQLLASQGTTWSSTSFDDVDGSSAKKLYKDINYCAYNTDPTYCTGRSAWEGYVRTVDGVTTTSSSFPTTTFIDFAVKCSYLDLGYTSLRCAESTWRLQTGSRPNATDHNNITQDVAATANPGDTLAWSVILPTLVDLVSFTVTPTPDSVLLEWETLSELDNLGYHVWRKDAIESGYKRITDSMIPAEGGPIFGAFYSYEDTDVEVGKSYRYKLEDIDMHGVKTFHGPVRAAPAEHLSVLTPQIGGLYAGAPPRLSWRAFPFDRFRIQFSATRDFSSKIVTIPRKKSSEAERGWIKGFHRTPSIAAWKDVGRLSGKDGRVYWRVVALDPSGYRSVSSPGSFRVLDADGSF